MFTEVGTNIKNNFTYFWSIIEANVSWFGTPLEW